MDVQEDTEQRNSDVTTVMFFLLHYMNEHPGATWGTYRVEDAFYAAARQLFPGEDPARIRLVLEDIG